LDRIDYTFIVILIIGSFLRLLFVSISPLNRDSYTFIHAAAGILEVQYNKYGTFRPPGFPLVIAPFILLTNNNYVLSAKLAAFSTSILLIFYNYYIFTQASKKLYANGNKKKVIKAKLVGLFVSSLITFNLYFVVHPGFGLREELLCILCILIFYYIVVKEEMKLKDNIYLALSITYLTLTLITAGFFFTIGIILFFLISKLKFFEFKKLSVNKICIIIFSFIISFLIWAIFSAFVFGDAFYNWQKQSDFFEDFYGMRLDSIENIIQAIINALLGGVLFQFYYFFLLTSIVFTIIFFYFLIKNLKKKQFLFIFLVFGLNLLYLSIFIAPSQIINIPNSVRVMMYFFPIIIYLGAIPLINSLLGLYEGKYKFKKNMIGLFIIFLITYSLKGLSFIIYLGYEGIPFLIHPLYLTLVSINEISLLIYLIIVIKKEILVIKN